MFREVIDNKYKPGQVWSYKTRLGEENSTILIIGAEEEVINEKQWKIFFHVIINNIQLSTSEGTIINSLNSISFPKDVLERSLNKLVGTKEGIPRYLSLSYREDIKAGEGGYFGSTIANAIEYIDRDLKCHPMAWH
jgi:hypothetical protein